MSWITPPHSFLCQRGGKKIYTQNPVSKDACLIVLQRLKVHEVLYSNPMGVSWLESQLIVLLGLGSGTFTAPKALGWDVKSKNPMGEAQINQPIFTQCHLGDSNILTSLIDLTLLVRIKHLLLLHKPCSCFECNFIFLYLLRTVSDIERLHSS